MNTKQIDQATNPSVTELFNCTTSDILDAPGDKRGYHRSLGDFSSGFSKKTHDNTQQATPG